MAWLEERRAHLRWPLMAAVLVLSSCTTMDSAANAACPESRPMEVEHYPSAFILPSGSAIEQQSHGRPSEYSSSNYSILADVPGTQNDILSFYRCALPSRNVSIISEEQGNVLLIRLAGEGIDDGSITLSEGNENGRIRVEIFVIENAK